MQNRDRELPLLPDLDLDPYFRDLAMRREPVGEEDPRWRRRHEQRGRARDYGEGEFTGSPHEGGRNIDPHRAGGLVRTAQLRPEQDFPRTARHEARGLQGNYGESNRFFGFDGEERRRHRGAQPSRGPKGYCRMDVRLYENVCDRLTEQEELDPSDIEVSVSNAEVTLRGMVQDRHEKRRAQEIVAAVRGVADVHNALRLRERRPWYLGG